MSVRSKRFLQPGHLVVSVLPATITTILGSCVAVCLWEPQMGIGGMNHFMLPEAAGPATASPRFGPVAMHQLLERMRHAGACLPLVRARVFGGSCMFSPPQPAPHLGDKNVRVALEFLTRRGIEIVQTDVGGERGRKVIFHTDEGTTWSTLI